MVITVTLNPALDKTLTINNFTLGTVNRASNIRQDIGGKGINVSKVLSNFNVGSVCTGFLGGMLENYFERELEARNIETRFIHIENNTRINTKIVDDLNKVYTDVNEPGPCISSEELNSFYNTFKAMCSKDDIVVLSGGVSPSIPVDIYGSLIKIARTKGAITILDAEGDLLKYGIQEKPNIIKPNIHELEKLVALQDDSEGSVVEAAKELIESGVEKVLVSLGEKGAIFVTRNSVCTTPGLKVPVKSTVGAGDSMVAALVYSLINNYEDEYTLKFANACGAASVQVEGSEACTLEQVNELLNKVKVKIREAKQMATKDMFSKERVSFNLVSSTKNEVIDELISLLMADGKLIDREEFKKAVLKREGEFSTGIGMGIAIPHGKSSAVKEASIVFGKSSKGIDYESMDDKPAHLFFLIAVPEESSDLHLRALSEISRKLMHTEVRQQLMDAKSFEDFIRVFE